MLEALDAFESALVRDPENPLVSLAVGETLFQLADQGTTILVSTHYMDEAERCHQLAILHQGVKVADGSPQALGEAISVNVVEVIADNANRARQAIRHLPQQLASSHTRKPLRPLGRLPGESLRPTSRR